MILELTPFDILPILASGVASLLIGFVWYGPLFGKPWAAYTGWTRLAGASCCSISGRRNARG